MNNQKFKIGQRVLFKGSLGKAECNIKKFRFKDGEYSYKLTGGHEWWIPESELEEVWK